MGAMTVAAKSTASMTSSAISRVPDSTRTMSSTLFTISKSTWLCRLIFSKHSRLSRLCCSPEAYHRSTNARMDVSGVRSS